MPRGYCAALLISMLMLSGCSSTTRAATQNSAQASTEQVSTGLANVLGLFGSSAGSSWPAYHHVKGISWAAAHPGRYGGFKFELSGHLLLAGFGPRKLPNGKLGSDYAEVDGNEGQSGVTLNGTKDVVKELSVKKFYFSEDYLEILQKQLPANFSITKIADQCRQSKDAEIDGKNSFFEINRPGQDPIYAEVWLEDGGKYSPGYTVFDFGRVRPVERIRQLECLSA